MQNDAGLSLEHSNLNIIDYIFKNHVLKDFWTPHGERGL